MRQIRLKYAISLPELAQTVGVSPQYLSLLELNNYYITESAYKNVQLAFDRVLATRRNNLEAMFAAYSACREHILDFVEESDGD
jgi:transcriptional regulator with XRE-family HTH domain